MTLVLAQVPTRFVRCGLRHGARCLSEARTKEKVMMLPQPHVTELIATTEALQVVGTPPTVGLRR